MQVFFKGNSGKNPRGRDGQIMKCSTCGSDEHLRAKCPNGGPGKRAFLVASIAPEEAGDRCAAAAESSGTELVPMSNPTAASSTAGQAIVPVGEPSAMGALLVTPERPNMSNRHRRTTLPPPHQHTSTLPHPPQAGDAYLKVGRAPSNPGPHAHGTGARAAAAASPLTSPRLTGQRGAGGIRRL